MKDNPETRIIAWAVGRRTGAVGTAQHRVKRKTQGFFFAFLFLLGCRLEGWQVIKIGKHRSNSVWSSLGGSE